MRPFSGSGWGWVKLQPLLGGGPECRLNKSVHRHHFSFFNLFFGVPSFAHGFRCPEFSVLSPSGMCILSRKLRDCFKKDHTIEQAFISGNQLFLFLEENWILLFLLFLTFMLSSAESFSSDRAWSSSFSTPFHPFPSLSIPFHPFPRMKQRYLEKNQI